MSKNNEINELAEIIKGLEKMAGQFEGMTGEFRKEFKEGFDKINNHLDKIDANSKEVGMSTLNQTTFLRAKFR
ncbi:hypothetical protein [Peribacillus simplex]|uniref:Uncharacterized protein n=1 Tax=Peribacillus simplex TaxID=1478 RepID=A0AAW7IP99_9BACI|nr:hypothetical protein [Peribacillus simplex]MDM5455229.1 hypothetical protein [Peribacillus simplex]